MEAQEANKELWLSAWAARGFSKIQKDDQTMWVRIQNLVKQIVSERPGHVLIIGRDSKHK